MTCLLWLTLVIVQRCNRTREVYHDSLQKIFFNVIAQSKTKISVSVFYLYVCCLVDHNKTISDG